MINKETQIRDLLRQCVKLDITVAFLSFVGAQAHTDVPHVAIRYIDTEDEVIQQLNKAIELRKNQLKNLEHKEFYELISQKNRLSEEG